MRTAKIKSIPTHPWDIAASQPITRQNGAFGHTEPIDPGVAFFVRALEALGAVTRFSCEGHPRGFYVAFEAPYELAMEIKQAGYFSVEIEGPNYWSIRKYGAEWFDGEYSEKGKVQTLRWAAEAWVRVFGDRIAAAQALPAV